jgi:nitrite reductase (NADH) small subunit
LVLQRLAKTSDISTQTSLIVEANGKEIGIYRFQDRYYAYLNKCPHQGGPACEGSIMGHKECEVKEGTVIREYFSDSNPNITCPWHGFDYELKTGISRTDRTKRLFPFKVVIQGDDVMVDVG